MRTLLLVAWLATVPAAGAAPLWAQASEDPAAASQREPLFTGADALFAGGFVLGTVAMAPLDIHLARMVRDSVPQANRVLRLGAGGFRLLGFPGSVLVTGGMYAAGRLADRPRLADIGLHATEAVVVGQMVNMTLKVLAGRARPRRDPDNPFNFGLGRGLEGDLYQSFPSGHTAAAFATAAALTHEIAEGDPDARLLVGTVLYTGAGLVGISRMYENWHWASDVVMGAAIGSFAGWKTVRYLHSRPDNPGDRWLLSISVASDLRGPVRLLVAPAPSR